MVKDQAIDLVGGVLPHFQYQRQEPHLLLLLSAQHLPVCQEQWQHMNIDRCHLVEIMKHQGVSEDVRRPSQRSIRNTKHHHKQAGMIRCQPRAQSHQQANYQLVNNMQYSSPFTQHSSILLLLHLQHTLSQNILKESL